MIERVLSRLGFAALIASVVLISVRLSRLETLASNFGILPGDRFD